MCLFPPPSNPTMRTFPSLLALLSFCFASPAAAAVDSRYQGWSFAAINGPPEGHEGAGGGLVQSSVGSFTGRHAAREQRGHRWVGIGTTHTVLYVRICNGSAFSLAYKRSGHMQWDYITPIRRMPFILPVARRGLRVV